MNNGSFDIETLRERLEGKEGLDYWRSLDEVAQTDEFKSMLHREFPEGAAEWEDGQGRRRFLKIMAASLALGAAPALAGCASESDDPLRDYEESSEKIVPYVEQPPEITPGKPLFFATALQMNGYAQGVLAESFMGRPIKVEGNPSHPASLGSTNAFMQASVLDLYDPYRSENLQYRGQVATWERFTQTMNAVRTRARLRDGSGLRVLTGPVTSPTLAAQLEGVLDEFPQARWHQHDPLGRTNAREGMRQVLDRDAQAVYRFDQAEVVFSIDADFLYGLPGSVRYAHDFAERRRVREERTAMNRLYVAESTPTVTGSNADHHLPLSPARLHRFAIAASRRVGTGVASEAPGPLSELEEGYLDALISDLRENAGESLVIAGPSQPPEVHALAIAMNRALDNLGQTVELIEPVEAQPTEPSNSLEALTRDMMAGEVETLLILADNPAYTAPADVPFADAIPEVETTIHLSTHIDETSFLCEWHVPRTHSMETWSDARAFDGTATVMQPLIRPLYDPCRSDHEVVAVLQGLPGTTSYDAVTSYWSGRYEGSRPFNEFWQQVLFDGVVPGTGILDGLPDGAIPGIESLGEERDAGAADRGFESDEEAIAEERLLNLDELTLQGMVPVTVPPAPAEGDLEIIFRPDPTLWDGQFANNGWMQELPKPLTKLTWDNAALISPSMAQRLDLPIERNGNQMQEVVELQYEGRTLEAPVWIMPGHPDDCVSVYLGNGREHAGPVGDGVGFDAYRLRTSDALWSGRGLTVEETGAQYALASTQHHWSMEGRHLAVSADIETFREDPQFIERPIELPSLYPEYEFGDGYEWGMSIDLNTCIGCNACVTACQAENNIPIVGKDQVRKGREMHWIRVDRYYSGQLDNPDTVFEPVPCMHCEKAPCEVVCPVQATVHSEEGLNLMIYNRCVGTRYCSNNCPYKVRRFNFFEFSDWGPEGHEPPREHDENVPATAKMRNNPDVTVRERGVMEKCTYCIQRISAARIRAKKREEPIRDGEVMTACQQACPTGAIVFGDLADETTEVSRLHEAPQEFALLEELGTRPRTTYLADFDNPNEELDALLEQVDEIRELGINVEV